MTERSEGGTETPRPVCFLVCAIKSPGSEERERADFFTDRFVKPVLEEQFNYHVIRSDDEKHLHGITDSIIRHLLQDDLVIVDLTHDNLNVGMELAIRMMAKKPLILARRSDVDTRVGSDLVGYTRIDYSNESGTKLDQARKELQAAVQAIRGGVADPADNPFVKAQLQVAFQGDAHAEFQRTVLAALERLTGEVEDLKRAVLRDDNGGDEEPPSSPPYAPRPRVPRGPSPSQSSPYGALIDPELLRLFNDAMTQAMQEINAPVIQAAKAALLKNIQEIISSPAYMKDLRRALAQPFGNIAHLSDPLASPSNEDEAETDEDDGVPEDDGPPGSAEDQ